MASNRYAFNSTFADHDLDNVFPIYPHGELNSDVGGQQLLYGERYFPEMALQLGLREDNWAYNDAKFDGYMYYQEMAWQVPTIEGTARGLLQEIPDVGYAGWVCEFKGELATERYTCRHVMIGLDENMSFGAPDLTKPKYEKTGAGFRCSVE